MAETQMSAPSWRKSKKMLLLKVAFGFILGGFILGYMGGIHNAPGLIIAAFMAWGVAGCVAVLPK